MNTSEKSLSPSSFAYSMSTYYSKIYWYKMISLITS